MTTVVWNGQNQETDGTLILKSRGKINMEWCRIRLLSHVLEDNRKLGKKGQEIKNKNLWKDKRKLCVYW